MHVAYLFHLTNWILIGRLCAVLLLTGLLCVYAFAWFTRYLTLLFGEQCLFTYPLIVLLLLCYFLPLLSWFLGHLPGSILHIQHILFFPWLFCIRLKHAFVFHLPLDIGGMFCLRTCLHSWLLLVASLFLPLLYCYIVFLSFFLGKLLFFWVFFLPSCPASVLP